MAKHKSILVILQRAIEVEGNDIFIVTFLVFITVIRGLKFAAFLAVILFSNLML